ncbi:MAG: hypothetical protein H0W86_07830 [Armatimonadetes bacterium]|nr:hypothetical protein [Armatimonadota bacterium]
MNVANRRALGVIGAVAIWAAALAIPPYWDTFGEHYKPPAGSALFKASCMTCHTTMAGGQHHNAYGKDIKAAMRTRQLPEVTIELLSNLESKDSDHDGFTNIEEIQGGFLPGASTSHPAPKEGQPRVEKAPKANEVSQLIPPHSFHPLAVHFPIALFIFGAFLEFLGKWRRNGDLRRFAIWNLGFGALASLIAVPTGIAAWLRVGFSLEGNLLIHFILASAATVLMLAVAAWRRKGELDSPFYWISLAATTSIVAAAGHFGALMVYG